MSYKRHWYSDDILKGKVCESPSLYLLPFGESLERGCEVCYMAKQDSNGLNGQLSYLEASKCATNNPKTQYTASMIQIPRCQWFSSTGCSPQVSLHKRGGGKFLHKITRSTTNQHKTRSYTNWSSPMIQQRLNSSGSDSWEALIRRPDDISWGGLWTI